MRSQLSALVVCAACLLLFACDSGDADDVAKKCVEQAATVAAQCPAGTAFQSEATGTDECSGKADVNVVDQDGALEGRCVASGSCSYLCRLSVEFCPCGATDITKEKVICTQCPTP